MKTAKFLIIGICCWVFTYATVHGQEAPTDYIITNDGATRTGTIARSFDFNNARTITFLDPEGKEFRFGPEDLKGFVLANGRTFESRSLPGKGEKELYFLQVILRGKVSLFSYNSRFFVESEKDYLELSKTSAPKTIQGNVIMTRHKQITGILNYMLYGPCGLQLRERIARTVHSESGFIDIIMMYHDCENLPYELLVEEIPVLRLSWVGMAGASLFQTYPVPMSDRTGHVFATNVAPFVGVGIKLDQWRRAPRFAFDLGIGFSWVKNTLNAQLNRQNYFYTATEEFSTTTVSVPVFIDYLVFRSSKHEYYLGAGANLRINSFQSASSMVDFKTKSEPVVVELYEEPIYIHSPVQFSPAFKAGTHLLYKEKWGIVSEFQLEYTHKGYGLSLGSNQFQYNQFVSTFILGFRL
ncbi:hypothetical protein SAMN05192553_106171 [Cyclobacterium xiamenense]|uniref:Outer membrane protein beta-barrel domain-containing protein n=1 Tax=Cyclobacterium xiamenense TaxID=1297121 RepID=A0A1H7AL58_9BACT|nr:hypothetical protein [Cyclobacterium xiamenense]SEJ62802.1 hypothetical protein SAMN05192553_106171 [Cyclobacterium xiamenense]